MIWGSRCQWWWCGRGGSSSTGDDAPESGPSSATSTVLVVLATRLLLPTLRKGRTVSSDACFMGMPSRVGPVAIWGLWAAMVNAPKMSDWDRGVLIGILPSRATSPGECGRGRFEKDRFPTSLTQNCCPIQCTVACALGASSCSVREVQRLEFGCNAGLQGPRRSCAVSTEP
jgi:hypothetical protein